MRYCFVILCIVFCSCTIAAQTPLRAGNRLFLLKQLKLSPAQRLQIQQLIREEKLEVYLRYVKLQQVLTPEQRKILLQAKQDREPVTDSLHH